MTNSNLKKKEFILTLGSRGRVHNSEEGTATGMLADHIAFTYRKQKWSKKWDEGIDSQSFPPVKFFLKWGSTS